jgi:hypothetical protein
MLVKRNVVHWEPRQALSQMQAVGFAVVVWYAQQLHHPRQNFALQDAAEVLLCSQLPDNLQATGAASHINATPANCCCCCCCRPHPQLVGQVLPRHRGAGPQQQQGARAEGWQRLIRCQTLCVCCQQHVADSKGL